MGSPLMNFRSTEAFLEDLGITIVKSSKEWLAFYRGKPLTTISIRHKDGGEKGIKMPYVWTVLREKLKRDGIKEGTKEYELELKKIKKEFLRFA